MHASERILLPASMAKRSLPLWLNRKALDEAGVFEGYASLFNREDLSHDIIVPGAFRDTLKSRGAQRIKMLFQHDPAEPIGVWEEIREDARGLYVRGRLTLAVAKAREVLALMQAGALDGLSIGFKAVKGRRDALGVRRLEKIDLWEISVVTFPMLPWARVESVKAQVRLAAPPTNRDFENWLTRDGQRTQERECAVLGARSPSLKALHDAGFGLTEDRALAARMREAARALQAG